VTRVPLLGWLSRTYIVEHRVARSEYHVTRVEHWSPRVLVSRNAHLARFLRDFFAGYDAGALFHY
jgi:hypothetical protein